MIGRKLFPLWAKATIFTQDGLTFIELPATKKGDMAMSFKKVKDTANYDFSRSGTMTDLLIVQIQNSFSMYAMTIMADSSYLKGNYNKVYQNSYFKMDTSFTGAVLFNRMDGTFVNGWRYQNGKVTRQLSAAPAGSTAIQVSGKRQLDVVEESC